MKSFKYLLTILLALLLLSPFVAADEFLHTLGGEVAPSLDKQELSSFITNEVAIWSDSASVQLNANHPNLEVTPNDFQFNIESSVQQFLDKADVPWYAFWKRKQEVHQPLVVTISDRLTEALDLDPSIDMVQSSNELHLKASVLSDEPIQLVASNISTSDMERFSFVHVQTGLSAAELLTVSELLNDHTLQPQEEFSLLTILNGAAAPISEETANFVASMFYIAVLQSEFEILERHSQGIVPNYTTLGLEAMISEKLVRDFKFKNTFDSPVTINVIHNAGVFLVEFYTLAPDSNARYEVGSREEIEPKRIERLVADLSYGAERKIETGRSGWRVTTYRTISSSTGSFETQEVVARDYYPPVHNVYEVSSQLPPEVVVTPTDGQTTGDGSIGTDGTTPGTDTPTDGTARSGSGDGGGTSQGGTTGDNTSNNGVGSGGSSSDGSNSNGGLSGDGSNNGYDKGGNKIN
ncbi:VanW family protein [Chryseomicrobium palamuruense]|uniref:VanW family protein n=1 Tax=Chryseomicrobium palamuruense TaxID=682973 RepID=A0ABV8UY87_9BACL